MLLQKFFPYFVVELLVEIFVVDDVDFVPMFCWMLRALSALGAALSILLLSGRVFKSVVLHILDANFLLTNSSISSLLLLLFCSSFA